MAETPSAPVPVQPDPSPTIAGASVEEEHKVELPKIEKFVLPIVDKKHNLHENLNKTVNHIQTMRPKIPNASYSSTNSCERVI